MRTYVILTIALALFGVAGYRFYKAYAPKVVSYELECAPLLTVPVVRCSNSEVVCYVFPGGTVSCATRR